jgi:hypothetical protein
MLKALVTAKGSVRTDESRITNEGALVDAFV